MRASTVGPMRVDERLERPELGEVADEVLAPVAAADDGDADIVRHGASLLLLRAHRCRRSGLDDAVGRDAGPAQALRVSTTTLAPSTSAA